MHTDLNYFSASCNSTASACDWGQNGLLCYSSCNSIVIYNPKYPGTNKDLTILTGHTDKVCVAKWVPVGQGLGESELVSTSNDGTAMVWTRRDGVFTSVVLKGHTDGVNQADCVYLDPEKGSLVIATGSIDSTVKIWHRDSDLGDFSEIQTIDFKRGLCVGLSLILIPNSRNILMACGRDTSKIELYVQDEVSQQFKLKETLKGHENWVPGLHFTTDDKGDLLLASSSQDKFIRIWRITEFEPSTQETSDIFTFDINAINRKFTVNNKIYSISIESVLCGHEGWVYEVRWAPKIKNNDGTLSQPMKLLSCSLDKTIIIWTLQETTGLWMETVRVGEVGGNTLGFYGCKFSPDATSIIGHGYLGSLHLWNYSSDKNMWTPGITPGGHSNQVVDICWEPQGQYLMSVGLDQTTRIHAPWVQNETVSWHEIARPQVHGYDMSCLAILSRYKFVSGAEEKIVRIFDAPCNFLENFRSLCNIENDPEGDEILNASKTGPRGASVPSLGLSNKAIYESSNEEQIKPTGKEYYPEETYFHEVHLNAPPTEEDLIQNTLWPEVQKLYGHGYEVYSVACSHDGKLVATACRATTIQHASIILWDAVNWQQIQKLQSHNLTVTQISFSPDDTKILSVSRDRRLTIFERNNETNQFAVSATTDKKTGIHTRIIWCCAWSHDSKYFGTGSRDGKVVIWGKNGEIKVGSPLGEFGAVGKTLEIKDQSVTAVAFAPSLVDGFYLVCVGFESGEMRIFKWNSSDNWQECLQINQSVGHHRTVKRIHFRPKVGEAGLIQKENILQIASCSSDHSVEIHNLYIK